MTYNDLGRGQSVEELKRGDDDSNEHQYPYGHPLLRLITSGDMDKKERQSNSSLNSTDRGVRTVLTASMYSTYCDSEYN